MDYKKIYNDLIQKAKDRNQLNGYTEKHHIVPKCMSGSDDEENLVELTAREHFIAHKLLCEIYPEEDGLYFALWMMSNVKEDGRDYKVSSRLYERLRIEFAKRSAAQNMKWWADNKGFSPVSWNDVEREEIGKRIKKWYDENGSPRKGKTYEEYYGRERAAAIKEQQRRSMLGNKNPMKRDDVKKRNSEAQIKWHKNNKHYKAKEVIHIKTGIKFSSMREAADEIGVSVATVCNHCKGDYKNQKFKYYGS